MIYLDNASTTNPKPKSVCLALDMYMKKSCINPGRSSGKHKDFVSETRQLVADFINAESKDRIFFTCSATDSLNMAIKGYLKNGDHVIVSSMEHNSVLRPLKYLENQGVIQLTVVDAKPDGTFEAGQIKTFIKSNTRLVAITHGSNVTGSVLPIGEIGVICKKNNITFLVDSSQTIGLIPIDVKKMNIDFLAFPGHKGLFSPAGMGGLYIRDGIDIIPFRHGGTGVMSEMLDQPQALPYKYESGTLNHLGIIGLNEGIKFINSKGLKKIHEFENSLAEQFYKELKGMADISVYGPDFEKERTPIVAVRLEGKDVSIVSEKLASNYKIITRAGLQCAPLAHKTIGTFEGGVIRFSFGYFNKNKQVEMALEALNDILKKK